MVKHNRRESTAKPPLVALERVEFPPRVRACVRGIAAKCVSPFSAPPCLSSPFFSSPKSRGERYKHASVVYTRAIIARRANTDNAVESVTVFNRSLFEQFVAR